MFIKSNDVNTVKMAEGVERKVLSHGGSLMSVEVSFKKGGVGTLHSHMHEQISYVIEGSFKFTLGQDKQIITVGDSCYIAPDVMHGVVALEDSKLIDVFSPQREDFL